MSDNTATLTKSQIATLKDTFSSYDKDGDGKISKHELGELLSKWHSTTEAELEDMINEIDVDGDGVIDFGEFLSMMSRHQVAENEEAELRAAFDMFDTNGDGQISTEEFKAAMVNLSVDATQSAELEKKVFAEGVEHISFEDFRKWMK